MKVFPVIGRSKIPESLRTMGKKGNRKVTYKQQFMKPYFWLKE
jgi:hypothetical protein